MTGSDIAAEIAEIAQPYVGRNEVDKDALIVGQLGINGTDFVEFLDAIEARFNVYLQEVSPRRGDAGRAVDVSINKLAAIVDRLTSSKKAARR